jgi:hypothetical protein
MSRSWIRPRVTTLAIVLSLQAAVAGAACPTSVDHTHAEWTAILRRWVKDGRVDYAALHRQARRPLAAYLAALSGACRTDYERWTTAERIAFWINAYNAFTVQLVLDHYPIASIRSIGWLPGAAFRRRFIPMADLEGRSISLDDIEHETLRKAFHEPRIHFALVCAARSCPALREEAYRGADLDRQLDDQGRAFLRDPAKNRVDGATRTLYLSSIFEWFRGDFQEAAGSLPSFVARYLDGDPATVADYRVEFLDYDWALNDREQGLP